MTIPELAAWMRSQKVGLARLEAIMGAWHEEYEQIAEAYQDLDLPVSNTQEPADMRGLIEGTEQALQMGRVVLAEKIAAEAKRHVAEALLQPAA